MKRWLYILFLVLLALPLHAQSEETARIRLHHKQEDIEQVEVIAKEQNQHDARWSSSTTPRARRCTSVWRE